jgi:hypothetical protein
MLDAGTRQRLNQLLHAHGLGPDPHVLYLIYRIIRHPDARSLIAAAPDLLDEALAYQLVTCERDEEDGVPYEVRLHPTVEYSLGPLRDPPTAEPKDGEEQPAEDS